MKQQAIELGNPGIYELAPAIVTCANWTMAPDGNTYLYFWAEWWRIVTDAGVPIDHFRSSERWQLHAVRDDGEPLLIIPGCGVKAVALCVEPPERTESGLYLLRQDAVGGGRIRTGDEATR